MSVNRITWDMELGPELGRMDAIPKCHLSHDTCVNNVVKQHNLICQESGEVLHCKEPITFRIGSLSYEAIVAKTCWEESHLPTVEYPLTPQKIRVAYEFHLSYKRLEQL